jgi:hypothetical protein
MFTLFEPVPLSSRAPNWAARLSGYSDVFGFSPFGDLFVCSSDGTQIALLRTERPELISLKFPSREEFSEVFLRNQNILQSVFRAADYNSLVERLGVPSPEDCFFPVPYPAIGGSGKLDTYQSGNVWVYLSIYAQTLGI